MLYTQRVVVLMFTWRAGNTPVAPPMGDSLDNIETNVASIFRHMTIKNANLGLFGEGGL